MRQPTSPALQGIALMLVSIFFFAILNALVKELTANYSAIEVSFFRCLFALIPVTLMVLATRDFVTLKTKRLPAHLGRGLFGMASMLASFSAFALLPLTDTVALLFSGPLFATLFSMILLRERVGIQRWSAILLGFSGVMIILRPTGDWLNWGALLALLSSFLFGFSVLFIRNLSKTESVTAIVFYFSLFSTLCFAALLPFAWKTPDAQDWPLFIACGVTAGIGQMLMTKAYSLAPTATVSPFIYSAIIWATLFDVALFGHSPAMTTLIGAIILIASGIFIIWREAYLAKQKA